MPNPFDVTNLVRDEIFPANRCDDNGAVMAGSYGAAGVTAFGVAMFRRFLFCVLTAMAHPASAETPTGSINSEYAEVGLWGVRALTARPTCVALLVYDDIGLAVEYDAKRGTVELALSNESATSVADDQKVKLKIQFATNGRWDDGWGEREFTARVTTDGSRMFLSEPFNKEMLTDIARQDYLIVTYGEKLVGGAKLDQSTAMVKKLRQCSIEAAGLNPEDPFLP